MNILRPENFRGRPVIAGLSTRAGVPPDKPLGMNLSYNVGDNPDAVRRNRDAFFGALGIVEHELAIPGQVHGNTILKVDHPGHYPDCDGLITACNRLFLCITIADCIPVLFFDPRSMSVGAVHSGWKGTVAAIAQAGIREMTAQFGASAEDILAYVGPGAGACCYEVGEEVARKFDERFVRRGSPPIVDLKGSIVDQMLKAGCKRENIEVSPACTVHEPEYHSFRRDGSSSGRMMACIGLFRPN